MLKQAIKTYEELKKYVFIINRGNKKPIIIKFKDENFYHLFGLHKLNDFDRFFPDYIKSQARKYKYMKKKISMFNGIVNNQVKEKDTLIHRFKTFPYILELLKSNNNVTLYDLTMVPPNSLYKGNYGLLKIYEYINCLLGLITNNETENTVFCSPQSWMVNTRVIQLTELKRPLYIENITFIPIDIYKDNTNMD